MKCPCCLNREFNDCCWPYLSGQKFAVTAEDLMRTRYTAFTQQNMDYLLLTTDPQVQSDFDLSSNKEWAMSVQFEKLEIIRHEDQGNKATVEFRATFRNKSTNELQVHHELSKFRKQKDKWYFREGKIIITESKT